MGSQRFQPRVTSDISTLKNGDGTEEFPDRSLKMAAGAEESIEFNPKVSVVLSQKNKLPVANTCWGGGRGRGSVELI